MEQGTVEVEGKGRVPIGRARAYEALGRKVFWATREEPAEKIEPRQYKDN